jgi:hypothetical protein
MMKIMDSAVFLTVPLTHLQFRVDVAVDVARKTGFEALCPRQVSQRTNQIISPINRLVYDLDE